MSVSESESESESEVWMPKLQALTLRPASVSV